jgi:glycerol-3-phosphate cytidylyltransferase
MVNRGFICGTWDLFHAGHLAAMYEAKTHCEFLTVGLQSASENKKLPVQGLFERYIQLQGCKFVDEIVPYDTEDDLYNLLILLNPDVRFLGSDYRGMMKPITGKDLSTIIYLERDHSYSTSDLIQRCKEK